MLEILKRLEIIKSSIAIDDEEIIELQIIKLRKLDIDDKIQELTKKLENLDYGSALNDIENYIKEHTGVVEYVDKEIQGLKLELKSLEKKLQALSQEKIEKLNDIEEFNAQYNIHLGDIIENILNLKKEILYKQTLKQQTLKKKYDEDYQIYHDSKNTINEIKETIKELESLLADSDKDSEDYLEIIQAYNELKEELNNLEDDLNAQEEQLSAQKENLEYDELFEQYEEVKNSYEEFHKEYKDIKEKQSDRLDLSDEEIKELKVFWKKASRLCHPDIVSDELKEKAKEMMQSLNDAYSKRDLKRVKQILSSLENGIAFEVLSDSINNKELLKLKIQEFRENINDIEQEIQDIKSNDTFVIISDLKDWDEYFEALKKQLEIEEERLKNEVEYISDDKEDFVWKTILLKFLQKYNIHMGIDITTIASMIELELREKYNINIPEEISNLKNLEYFYISQSSIQNLPESLGDLQNLKRLYLHKNNLKSLPANIVKLVNLKTLQISDNNALNLTTAQIEWIVNLIKNGCDVSMDNDLLKQNSPLETHEEWMENLWKWADENKIAIEQSTYSKKLLGMQLPTFEKIRRYNSNLVDDNKADDMQTILATEGKMYKALIYDALEQFIHNINAKIAITLVDWGCGQGIASSLVIDYIKEKQLDIEVRKVILVDDDIEALSRAMLHVSILKQNDLKIIAINTNNSDDIEKLNSMKNNFTINLFANDKMPMDYLEIDYEVLGKDYFVCVSSENNEMIKYYYEKMSYWMKKENIITDREAKIGKFKKFEKIFSV